MRPPTVRWVVHPLSYFSFQPVFHYWCKKKKKREKRTVVCLVRIRPLDRCTRYLCIWHNTSTVIHYNYCLFIKKERHVCRPPPVPENCVTRVFHFIFVIFKFPPENGAKTLSSMRSDIRYRLIRKHFHSCTGDMWCQITEVMTCLGCSRVDYNCRFV